MIKKIVLILFVVVFSLKINAQPAMKGFKFLDKPDFDKALEIFSKNFKEDSLNSMVNMGFAIIYSDPNFTGKDYFKAWDFFERANLSYSKLTESENAYLKQFFSDRDVHMHNRPLRFIYDYEMKLIEDKLIKFVREENNLEVATHFIRVYPNSRYFENVIHIRNHLEFRIAEKTNTLEAYHTFMSKYPDAAQMPKATKACYQLAFDLAKQNNSVDGYNAYMKDYPKADQYFEALKLRDQLAFEQAKKANTIEALEEYISSYPKAIQLMSARTILRKLLYDRAKEVNTLEAYNDFILRYPEGEYFVDIFNLKTNILGKNIAEKFQGNKESIIWIKGFDYLNLKDESGGICTTTDGNVIVCGSRTKQDGDSTEAWVIGMDLTGKIHWNKAFGTKRQNHASSVRLSNDGNLLIAGWSGNFSDTSYRSAWMFKIAPNGNGIWERNFEGCQINDFVFDPEGDLYFCGYKLDDSLHVRLFLAKYNEEFKKVWSRLYLKKGSLNGFILNQKYEIFCASGKWVWKTDKQGYLISDKYLEPADSIYSVLYQNNQYTLIGNKLNLPLIIRQNENGISSNEVTFPDYQGYKVKAYLLLPNKQNFVLLESSNGLIALFTDDKFKVLKHIEMPDCSITGFSNVCLSSLGEILLTITATDNQKKDIAIMKLSF